MNAFFSALQRGSYVHESEVRNGCFVIRPKPGLQTEFDRLARVAIHKAGRRYSVHPETNGALGWSSLTIMPLM